MLGVMADIVVDEEVVLSASPDAVWEHFHAPEGYALFVGYGPIPALVRVDWIEGDHERVGSIGRVQFADGSTQRERVLRSERPHRYEIAIDEFSSVFRFVVREAREDVRFVAEGSKTRLVRRFTFTPRNALAVPVALVIRRLFRRAVQRNHEGLVRHFDGSVA
jgi:uncharacterized protein YndB with AHSA1/START domain